MDNGRNRCVFVNMWFPVVFSHTVFARNYKSYKLIRFHYSVRILVWYLYQGKDGTDAFQDLFCSR